MRRLLLILLVVLIALPAAATAGRRAPADGSLTIRNASGKVVVQGKGLIYGYLERGSLTVSAYVPDGLAVPSVSGARLAFAGNRLTAVYTGKRIRFLFPGGAYSLRFEGYGLDLTGVGTGQVQALGLGPAQAVGFGTPAAASRGTIAVDGERPVPVGSELLTTTYGVKVPTTTPRSGRT
jgi:hypothetical protein